MVAARELAATTSGSGQTGDGRVLAVPASTHQQDAADEQNAGKRERQCAHDAGDGELLFGRLRLVLRRRHRGGGRRRAGHRGGGARRCRRRARGHDRLLGSGGRGRSSGGRRGRGRCSRSRRARRRLCGLRRAGRRGRFGRRRRAWLVATSTTSIGAVGRDVSFGVVRFIIGAVLVIGVVPRMAPLAATTSDEAGRQRRGAGGSAGAEHAGDEDADDGDEEREDHGSTSSLGGWGVSSSQRSHVGPPFCIGAGGGRSAD